MMDDTQLPSISNVSFIVHTFSCFAVRFLDF
jgi:hypothetical protein